jgi:putative spermidine/putrescine transport system substrate-binding protein
MPDIDKTASMNLSRRTLLKGAAGAAAFSGVNLFSINHAWSKDVVYDGGVFDAGGATLRIAEWGGFWEELMRKELINAFEKDFNCKVAYDSAGPWYPKYMAAGPKAPPFAINNWNFGEMFKTAAAGDYLTPVDEMVANMPNASRLWPFATANGVGITWCYSRYCYGYRTDLVDPAPATFKDFWEKKFANKRGTLIPSNGLQIDFFIASCALWGKDQYDLEAGYEAMRQITPIKLTDFTGSMQALLERGEVEICLQHDGEIYQQMDKGIKAAPYIWSEIKPILTQNKTISRYLDPLEKKLAYAYLNRVLDPKFQTMIGAQQYQRPVNMDAAIAENLASKGVKNTADAVDGYFIADWKSYLEHEDDIVETVTGIFAG